MTSILTPAPTSARPTLAQTLEHGDVLPIALRFAGRRVVLVGGGEVSARRAQTFVDVGADVRVISPELAPALAAMAEDGAVSWCRRRYVTGDLDGAWFAHVATGVPNVDAQVASEAERARVWCVQAADGAASDAWMSGVARYDGIVVGINAGRDPRRAKLVRDAVEMGMLDGSIPSTRFR